MFDWHLVARPTVMQVAPRGNWGMSWEGGWVRQPRRAAKTGMSWPDPFGSGWGEGLLSVSYIYIYAREKGFDSLHIFCMYLRPELPF